MIRRAPPPTPLPHMLPSSQQEPLACPQLIRRVPAPISPPPTSPPPWPEYNEDQEGNGDDDLGHKQKGCNLLWDALEEEVTRKKRKRGIVK